MVPVRTEAGALVDQLLWWTRVAKQGERLAAAGIVELPARRGRRER